MDADRSSAAIVDALLESKIYKDYQEAFTRATGLPLGLLSVSQENVSYDKSHENLFCALMAKTNQSCMACFAIQKKLEEEASLKPKTLKCFAGLCETAVPVRVGDKLIAFLRTGQILLSRPGQRQFTQIAEQLIRWGTEIDLKQFEEAYFNTRVLSGEQYQSMIKLLTVFAEHLASCSSSLMTQTENSSIPAVAKARGYILENFESSITLPQVAQVVNVSANYFSEMFKKSTGLNFVDYVGRVRVEKAKNLLQNPHRRVTEVAFEVGFQSVSQFNRVFKRIVNQSPTHYRASFARLPGRG